MRPVSDSTPNAPYGTNKRTGKPYVRKPYEKRTVGNAKALAAAAQAVILSSASSAPAAPPAQRAPKGVGLHSFADSAFVLPRA
eukprot:3031545-Pleurochrysis_carterae.AAC.1